MEQGSFQYYLIGLLAIGNNVSAIGAFLAHTRRLPPHKVKRIIWVASGACLAMLLLFLLLGTAVLDFFGISISAFQIAGGLLLGGLGFDMMKSRQPGQTAVKSAPVNSAPVKSVDVHALDDKATDDKAIDALELSRPGDDAHLYATAVVPIAIPFTVGAGTFSAVILFADLAHRSGSLPALSAAIVALVAVNYVVFSFSSRIVRFAGEVGLSVFTRIMGLFTLAIGVEFILRGLTTVYRQFHAG